MQRSSGFSLIELLMAVAVLGVLLGIAIPGFSAFRETLAQTQTTNQLVADLRYARQTSVTRHRPVVIAFGNGSVTTNITTYTIHTDLDGDLVKDSNEQRITRGLAKRVRISNATFTPHTDSLLFDTSGLLVSGSSGGRLIIAGRRGRPDTLNISAVGMVYQP